MALVIQYSISLQADQSFTPEKCSICDKRFVNARGKHLLLRHFHQSTSSSSQGKLIKQIGIKFLEFSIARRRFSNCYDFKNPDNVIREFIDIASGNWGSREGEFVLICSIFNQSLAQVESLTQLLLNYWYYSRSIGR